MFCYTFIKPNTGHHGLIKIYKSLSTITLTIHSYKSIPKFLQPIFDQQTFSNQRHKIVTTQAHDLLPASANFSSLLLLLNSNNIIDIVVISLVHETVS